jgi:hypothetical protein
VWTVDDEGNFIKTYPFHPPRRHRAQSSANLNQEQKRLLYAEIEKDVKEKYFNCSSSMDQLAAPFKPLARKRNSISGSEYTQSRSSLPPAVVSGRGRSSITPMRSSLNPIPGSGAAAQTLLPYSPAYQARKRSHSVTPIRSVTAKILHKLGDTIESKTGSSSGKKKGQDLMFDQVLMQLQQMSSQQEYLQTQVVMQQQQFKEAMGNYFFLLFINISLINEKHLSLLMLHTDMEVMSRSSTRKDEMEFKSKLHEQRIQRSLTRAQIQEQICAQQNKLSDHIIRLQQQLDMLLEKKSQPIEHITIANPGQQMIMYEPPAQVPQTKSYNPHPSQQQPPPRPPPPQHQDSLPALDDPDERRDRQPHSGSLPPQPPRPRTPVPGSSSPAASPYTRPASVPPHHHYPQHMDSLDADPDDPDEIWLNELQLDRLQSNHRSGEFISSTFKSFTMTRQESESYECLYDEDEALDLPPVDDAVTDSLSPQMLSSPEVDETLLRVRRELREQEMDREMERKKREKEESLRREMEEMEMRMKMKQQELIMQAEQELQEVLKQSSLQQQEFEKHRQMIEQQERELMEKNKQLQQQAMQQQQQIQMMQQQVQKQQQQQNMMHRHSATSLTPIVPQRGRSGSLRPIQSKDQNNMNRSASDLIQNPGAGITSLIASAKDPIIQTASMVSRSMAQPSRPVSPQPPFAGHVNENVNNKENLLPPHMRPMVNHNNNLAQPNDYMWQQQQQQLQQPNQMLNTYAPAQERGRSRSPRPNQNMSQQTNVNPNSMNLNPNAVPERLRSPSPVKSSLLRTRSPSPRAAHVTFSDERLDQVHNNQSLMTNTLAPNTQQFMMQRGVSPRRSSEHGSMQQQQQGKQQLTRPEPGQPLQFAPTPASSSLSPFSPTSSSSLNPNQSLLNPQTPPHPPGRSSSPARPKRSGSPYRGAAGAGMTEAFMDHFDHYASSRALSSSTPSRLKSLKSRSRSKEPEHISSNPFPSSRSINRANSRSAVFLDEDTEVTDADDMEVRNAFSQSKSRQSSFSNLSSAVPPPAASLFASKSGELIIFIA